MCRLRERTMQMLAESLHLMSAEHDIDVSIVEVGS